MTNDEVVREFLARICRGDLAGACELVADDVEYDNVPMGKQFGPAGITGLLGPIFDGSGTIDGADWVIHRQVASGSTVMNERTDRFRVKGEWVDLPVAGVFEVNDEGRITLWRDYFDMATMTKLLFG